ncbi:MAG: hypothetical protein E7417_04630 [Ruminococcaceae bacterium]|nr:hypothetical protein [Oscillospiraceae bacterium]
MDNNVNDRLKSVLSGIKSEGTYEPIMKLLTSSEGQKLMKNLSPADKKAIVDRFMSLDKNAVQNSLKNFDASKLSGLSARDILDKLR